MIKIKRTLNYLELILEDLWIMMLLCLVYPRNIRKCKGKRLRYSREEENEVYLLIIYVYYLVVGIPIM
jgi:hypothetical protein